MHLFFRSFIFDLFLGTFVKLSLQSSTLFGAAPVTHAYLTERFFQVYPHYNAEERKAFMVGTLFADIRYLGEACRHETHFRHIALADILNEKSAFLAGLKFHSYVDEERENFVIHSHIYDYISKISPHNKSTFLKFLEDELIFNSYNWTPWTEALKEIHPEELDWNMQESTIRKWHNLLTLILINPPSTLLFLASSVNLNFLNNDPKHWNKIMSATLARPQVKNYMHNMLLHIETKMKPKHVQAMR